ncbi:hypothetical protein KIPB_001170 [Kipferlia bialata]|uniref:Uncharacterized protein n=1 Tax=Kipferlia bialata TaxID=797122 RepID=A0A9K3CQA9_9EUKA|nr:hypothetical protein KIPB_001170 [Kipferlia bialata]|eukprot:g1170.t1
MAIIDAHLVDLRKLHGADTFPAFASLRSILKVEIERYRNTDSEARGKVAYENWECSDVGYVGLYAPDGTPVFRKKRTKSVAQLMGTPRSMVVTDCGDAIVATSANGRGWLDITRISRRKGKER